MDERDGRREVVATDSHRAAATRPEGHYHRVCRRVEGIPGSNRDGVSEGDGAAVYRAHGAEQLGICELEGTQDSGGRSADDLSVGHYRRSRAAAGRVRKAVEWSIRVDRENVASALERDHAIVRVSGGDPAGDLHDQRGRVVEHDVAESDQD